MFSLVHADCALNSQQACQAPTRLYAYCTLGDMRLWRTCLRNPALASTVVRGIINFRVVAGPNAHSSVKSVCIRLAVSFWKQYIQHKETEVWLYAKPHDLVRHSAQVCVGVVKALGGRDPGLHRPPCLCMPCMRGGMCAEARRRQLC